MVLKPVVEEYERLFGPETATIAWGVTRSKFC